MVSSPSISRNPERQIHSAGDCPVCADSGALILLKASGLGKIILFCPLCGVAWREPPADRQLDEISTLESLAPNGVTLPTSSEALATGFQLTEHPLEEWFPLLKDLLRGSVDPG
jgi:hypothetical protein